MKILALSDVHCQFEVFSIKNMCLNVEKADLILIAGDLTNFGDKEPHQVEKLQKWLSELAQYAPVKYITGNHDLNLHKIDFGIENVENITDKLVVFEGFKILGLNMTVCYDLPQLALAWDRMTAREEVEEAYYNQFTEKVDIVLSHSPLYGILDVSHWDGENIGSKHLREYVERIAPKLVIHGHNHTNVEGGEVKNFGKAQIVNVGATFRHLTI
jgi:Icc-related predicted phosphoesterase